MIQKKIFAALLAVGLSSFCSVANASDAQNINETVYNDVKDLIQSQKIAQRNTRFVGDEIAQRVQLQTLSDYAKQLAMQSAMRSGASNINQILQQNSRNLDAIYNFQPLMIHGKIVPPVVTEAVDLFNQSGDMQIRLTDKVYDIVSQAKLSSTPPNWRDYLQFSDEPIAYDDNLFMTTALSPKSKLENQVWEKATREGWELGIKQANFLLTESLDRLNRDYIGMIRFHQLVAEGRLDMPALSSYELYESTDGSRLLIGEKLFQLTSLPQFQKAPSDVKRIHNGNIAKQGYISQQDAGALDTQPNITTNPQVKDAQPAKQTTPVRLSDVNTQAQSSQVSVPEQQVVTDGPYVRSIISRRVIADDSNTQGE